MDRNTYKLVAELKRRRVFVSLLVTRTGEQYTWWVGVGNEMRRAKNDPDFRPGMRTGDADSVRLWLRGQAENDRREIQYVGRRLGYAR